MNIEKFHEYEKLFNNIEKKIQNRIKLTLDEEEMLGILKLREKKDIHLLEDEIFENYKFRHLAYIYSTDYSYKSNYYKLNFDKNQSDFRKYEKGNEINSQEFDVDNFNAMINLRIQLGFLILIDQNEVKRDAAYLKTISLKWSNEMLNERHVDKNLAIIAKETRDTIKKSNLERYISGNVSEAEEIDIRKALLKSKYIHNEALIIQDIITAESSETKFKLNGNIIHYEYISIIHILNRHFGPGISNISITESKTFHNPKIVPRSLHKTFKYFIELIENSGLLREDLTPNFPIYLNYYNCIYAMYLDLDKLDKNKIVIKTFYEIDSSNSFGKNELNKIKEKYSLVYLDANLGLYTKNFS
ncbi:MAG TPA: hypothetical protein VK164_05165 [Flavobacterium sp.]|uniref:hypothetical protein n=1 Tax=Flavobacterium sp. TaxID=239 RepID=UPI002B4ACAA9|nr:hypothetical protein [Flavobacterium sp.]HLO73308.1 hypothetical protein [Flavobacterium sp.]